MNENAFGALGFFIAMYFMMAFDFVLHNIGFLFVMILFLILGSYCGTRWVVEKRKIELEMKNE